MELPIGYKCSLCAQEYDLNEVQYTCPQDGGNLDVLLDYSTIRRSYSVKDFVISRENSLWRYLPLLPVDDPGGDGTPLRAAGWTPVFSPPRLAQELGLSRFWVKDESRNPTASFKDRASAVVVARAREIGAEVVVTASTGNAGAALAGMCAAVGQKAVIFAPRTAPPAKVAQLLVYGAQVLLVDGTYDDAFDLTIKAAQEFGWYCRNTGYNPFTVEGKKTAAFEIWELIERGLIEHSAASPLNIFVSVGDGNIISGLHKGFKDLSTLGWLEQMPRIFGVQAEGSAAIANAFFAGTEKLPRSQPKPWQTASRSICRGTGCERCGRRVKPAARTSRCPTDTSSVPSANWEKLASSPNLPARLRMPACAKRWTPGLSPRMTGCWRSIPAVV
jgi:threonine synthase